MPGGAINQCRDRDYLISQEGLIFRVYGYDHPDGACFCDVEYASESVYKSSNPRALREGSPGRFYKFYSDEGLRFVLKYFPHYTIHHKALKKKLVGLKLDQAIEIRKPDQRLAELTAAPQVDRLVADVFDVLDIVTSTSSLSVRDFGVFGSIMHGFHNPRYSDIDLIVYGRRQLAELRETLADIYSQTGPLRNEFDRWDPSMPPYDWRFKEYTKEEYGWYQRRKLIYGVYSSKRLKREVNVEFEPVRRSGEIRNEYPMMTEIRNLGWTMAVVRVIDDRDSFFMPSVYEVEIVEILEGVRDYEIERVVSFVEEFRGQLFLDEVGLVRGKVEVVHLRSGKEIHQLTLSYWPGYHSQYMKLLHGI